MGSALEVRIVGRRVITAKGVPPAARIWLPLDGKVIAKLPGYQGNRRWLHETVGIRSPDLVSDRWKLPRNCMVRLVTAAIDRFGYVAVWRDMARLSHCDRRCLEAAGMDCQCSCMGAFHGQNAGNWFERIGEAMVSDQGETTRTVVIYGPPIDDDSGPRIYAGELRDRRYRVDRGGRAGWPLASEYMCASCLSVQASVWDHCHAHGYVRAPLCSTCNTRHWSGWSAEHGRAEPSRNVDTSYYRWCPGYGEQWDPCSR